MDSTLLSSLSLSLEPLFAASSFDECSSRLNSRLFVEETRELHSAVDGIACLLAALGGRGMTAAAVYVYIYKKKESCCWLG